MQDLRAFLALAEERGHLLRIPRPVDADTEAGALIVELERRGKVGLFECITGREGRLAANLLGRRDLLAAALGVVVDDVVPTYQERLGCRVPVALFEGKPPVQEVVLSGADADLGQLPVIVHASKDAGAYITAGIVLARDPATGRRNVSINRMQVKDAHTAGIRMMPPQQLGVLQARAEETGAGLPI